ncbi:hypothetical protein LSH36_258g05108 [Paralvinella palmiformis]|uniref:Uncharacterized protein n=1 Tax=Paralvinella palmiformis TaxID=53620 RepID=A0AAD9JKA2_9ANNE|nr:hypothetical protein LSH36_258g05108 [Paralvinella palmiformis]
MSTRRVLDLGHCGKIPVDTLFQLHLETRNGHMITLHQSKMARSLGSWVYDGASVLARYIEAYVIDSECGEDGSKTNERPLTGKSVVELGAGTGIVGILMGYYGADVITTDLETLVPLIQYNIERNAHALGGRVRAEALCWGDDLRANFPRNVDYIILANCVYYEGVLELLAKTTKQLAGKQSVVFACYEERIPEIRKLIEKWHEIVGEFFAIEEIPREYYRCMAELDCIRIVKMKAK